MRSLVYIVWFGMTLLPVQLFAQGGWPVLSGIDSILNPPLLGGGEILFFEASEQQVGSLSEDDKPVAFHFRYQNISKDTVSLTRIATSCGCTTAEVDKRRLAPGGEGCITLVFNPKEQAGSLYKTAFVYTTLSDKQPVAKLALVGEVRPTANRWVDYPYVLGSVLRMRQPLVRFRKLSGTEIRTERIACVNSGEVPLQLVSLLLPSYAKLRTEPEVIPAGEEADLVVSIDGRLLPPDPDNDFSFSIVLDGLEARPSDRTLQVKVSLQQ